MKKCIFVLLACFVTLSSCNDWFDVTSDSEIREKDHYSTLSGFQQTLIGCYLGMTDDALYGKYTSWFMPEILGHQYNSVVNFSSTTATHQLEQFNYDHATITSSIENVWAKAYSVIANANEALIALEKEEQKEMLGEAYYNVIKGELHAIRAYLHFDLLRLYGYGNWEKRSNELNVKNTIPYVTTLSYVPTPQRTGQETIKMILEDLITAEKLLQEYDPITQKQPSSYYSTIDTSNFLKERTLRLNYYAVKALEARVYLWEGSDESIKKALDAAEEIITAYGDNGIRISDMNTYSYLLNDINSTNKSLVLESLFCLNVTNITEKITSYIIPNFKATDYNALYISDDDVQSIYENINSDIRFSQLLTQTQSDAKGYTCTKLVQTGLTAPSGSCIPLIRLPEIYYIAAECYAKSSTPDLTLALKRLNKIREIRCISTPLENLNAQQIQEEIQKEYRKEFISEGVMFYYYKRTGCTTIPHYNEEMTDKQYVLPYPNFELQSGRIQ